MIYNGNNVLHFCSFALLPLCNAVQPAITYLLSPKGDIVTMLSDNIAKILSGLNKSICKSLTFA